MKRSREGCSNNRSRKLLEFHYLNIILFYNYQIFLHGKEKNKLFFHRSDFSEVTSEMKKNNIKSPQELNILAFSDKFQTWFILSDYKYLSIIHNIYSPRKDNVQEDRIIYTFKFLKLNVNDFLNFFSCFFEKFSLFYMPLRR